MTNCLRVFTGCNCAYRKFFIHMLVLNVFNCDTFAGAMPLKSENWALLDRNWATEPSCPAQKATEPPYIAVMRPDGLYRVVAIRPGGSGGCAGGQKPEREISAPWGDD